MTVKLCLGSNRVVVSTYTEATGRDLSRYSMLCEKGKGLFIPSESEKDQRTN